MSFPNHTNDMYFHHWPLKVPCPPAFRLPLEIISDQRVIVTGYILLVMIKNEGGMD